MVLPLIGYDQMFDPASAALPPEERMQLPPDDPRRLLQLVQAEGGGYQQPPKAGGSAGVPVPVPHTPGARQVAPAQEPGVPLVSKESQGTRPKYPVPGRPGVYAGWDELDAITQDALKAQAERERKLVEKYDDDTRALKSRKLILEQMRPILKDPNYKSGPTESLTLDLRNFLRSAGLLTEDQAKTVDLQTMMRMYSNQLALKLHELGTGAVSDRDLMVFLQAIPTVGTSGPVTEHMIDTMLHAINHLDKINQFRTAYWGDKLTLRGFDEDLKKSDLSRLYKDVREPPQGYEPKDTSIHPMLDYFRNGIKPGDFYIGTNGRLYKKKATEDEDIATLKP
jgi:hypothetical protein